jgi:hypothetical protein
MAKTRNLLDFSGKALTDGFRLVESRYYTGTDFLASAQGITNDGRCYYCTGTVLALGFHGLSKIDMQTGEVLLKKKKYLPPELAKQGFCHYGGCTYFEGKLYVAVEDEARAHPCIAVFDADTLTFTGEYRILGPEIQPNGNLPWCAADKENRLLYTGYFNHCDHINVFEIDTLDFIRHIPISRVVEHTQGGEMWGGLMYISCHDTWRKKHIFAIDPATGETTLVMARDAGKNIVESEGITVCPMEDGSFFHQLDVIYPFTLAIRRYTAPAGVEG